MPKDTPFNKGVINKGLPPLDRDEALKLYKNTIIGGLEKEKKKVDMDTLLDEETKTPILQDINKIIGKLSLYPENERIIAAQVFHQNNLINGVMGRSYVEIFSKEILPFLKRAPSKKVLEIGFGLGYSLNYFNNWDYHGLEVSDYAIWSTGKSHPSKKERLIKTNPGETFPFSHNCIDCIVAINAISHIPKWKFELDECKRVLVNNGRISIVERTPLEVTCPIATSLNPDYNNPTDITHYLSENGFKVQTNKFRATFFGEVIMPNGYATFAHVKGIKS